MADASKTSIPKYEVKFSVIHHWRFPSLTDLRRRLNQGNIMRDTIALPIVGQYLRLIMVPKDDRQLFELQLEYDGDHPLKIMEPSVKFYYKSTVTEAPRIVMNDLLFSTENTICRFDWCRVRSGRLLGENAGEPQEALTIVINFNLEQQLKNNNEVVPMLGWYSDLKDMYKDRDSADFTLECGDHKLKCHSFILAARSNVFKQMLSHNNFSEVQKRVIKIQDTDVDILKAFVKFLYTDFLGSNLKIAEGLLIMADKYIIHALRMRCENILMNNMNVNNALYYYKLASVLNNNNMKNRALDTIGSNLKTILKSQEWLDMKVDPNAMSFYDEILSHIADRK